ncbi:hypothetical protein ALC57_18258 [Trachymyrmex cornetzi]|uniref:Uncharacterized protein n=1 Tax=Trachymyrmex cornetzi TaxID=471704 RepID=A0A195DA47_9HYME|nr:hypothetical protein ALC57_18258 [Trachymyrmex cornetzi]
MEIGANLRRQVSWQPESVTNAIRKSTRWYPKDYPRNRAQGGPIAAPGTGIALLFAGEGTMRKIQITIERRAEVRGIARTFYQRRSAKEVSAFEYRPGIYENFSSYKTNLSLPNAYYDRKLLIIVFKNYINLLFYF